jgi:nitronate monooxygenase
MADLRDVLPGPVVVGPMAGGPTTVDLVVAASRAGALGFLAGGYRPATALAADVATVRERGVAAFGVNVFVPGAPTADPDGLARHLAAIAPDAAALGVALAPATWDDDDWEAKAALLVAVAPPVVSFTFGLPPASLVAALRAKRSRIVVTVTNRDEALAAVEVGVDGLCAQGVEAGGHRATFDPTAEADAGLTTVALVAALGGIGVPVLAAGGVTSAAAVTAARSAGATAVQCGTAFLRCPEAGTHPTYRAALADGWFSATASTRSFSGRPARGLVNAFMREHPTAVAAYPELNAATRPLRAAAAAAGDAERMSLWAGTAWRDATDGTASDVVAHLASGW